MTIQDFAHFVAVVQHGGYSAAARAIGTDKVRLSRSVALLESQVGARLINRTTRSVSLTEAGQRFHRGCQMVLDSARAAFDSVAELTGEPAGTVRIGCSAVAAQNLIAPILPRYLAAHPKVTVLLEHGDRAINPIERDLDLALVTQLGSLPEASLVARELGRVRRIPVIAPALRDALGCGSADPAHLAGVPLIARTDDMADGEVRWHLAHDSAPPARITGHARLVTNDLNVQIEAVIAGCGVALLPSTAAAAALRAGRIVPALPGWSSPEYSLHLVYPLPRGSLPSVRSLIDFLGAELRFDET